MSVLKEENGVYAIDVTNATWATDQVHELYHKSGIQLNDVDFLIECKDEAKLIAVEYKNANIPDAVNPDKFNPAADKYINKVSQKFYDTLHYLYLSDQMRPINYVYIVEYPKGDVVSRLRLRERIRKGLPFKLQENYGKKLIAGFDVLSIKEWNENELYGKYPIVLVENN